MRLRNFSPLIFSLAFLLIPLTSAATLSITPQEQYSSCIGVLGCKINTNRVAYFAGWPDCDKLCKRVTYQGRHVNLLHIDTSASSYNDISYDAWNYLVTGQPASVAPTTGPGYDMDVADTDMSECMSLLPAGDGKIPFSAPNDSFLTSRIASAAGSKSNYVSRNYALFNIYTSTCTLGVDEPCTCDPTSKLTSCPNQLGLQTPLRDGEETVQNVQVGMGKMIPAVQ